MAGQIKSNPCKECSSSYHTRAFCPKLPRAPLKRWPIKKRATSTGPRKASNKTPRQKAKEQAWDAFSTYIRLRDSLATTGTTTSCVCVTCRERGDHAPKPFKMIQAGHAVGGRGNAVLFHEEIVNGQCSYCNQKPPMGLGGDYGNYALYLVKKYGLDHAEALQRLKGTYKDYKTHDFIRIKEEYKDKARNLLT